MIIFDNIIFSIQKTGGISKFWSKLIDFDFAGKCKFIEPYDGKANNIYRDTLQIRPVIKDIKLPLVIRRYLNIGRNLQLKNKHRCKVFHSSYYRICTEPGVINITTVHDFIYEKYAFGLARFIHLWQKRKALRYSDCIVCVSENTRQDLLYFYPELTKKNVYVIPNGVDRFYNLSQEHSFRINNIVINPQSYFLYVGHRGSCKGFNLVCEVLNELTDINLIVVGRAFNDKEINLFKQYGVKGRVINVGTVSDIDLNKLYSNAKFFFFPSLYEGFGIPPLEAMVSCCPVVASSRSSIPEVVGDAAILFDPDSSEQIKDAIHKVLDASVRASLVKTGLDRALQFSWDNVRKQYWAIYDQYLNMIKK